MAAESTTPQAGLGLPKHTHLLLLWTTTSVNGGRVAALAFLVKALGQPVRFLLSGVPRDVHKTFDKETRQSCWPKLFRLFDEEKTRQEGSCLMQLRAVPFRDVLLAC